MMSMKKEHLPAFVVAGMAGLFLLGTPAVASGIVAHQAFYEMRLGDREQNSSIVDVLGKSAFMVERDCDGWVSMEDYMIEFMSENGVAERIMSHFESWESVTGDKYSFGVTEDSTFLGRKDYNGFADLNASKAGRAVFAHDSVTELALPEDTFFPVRHMEYVLAAADSGETMMAATLFTGGEPEDALMKTSTVVGGWQERETSIDLGALSSDGYWPVQVAYFKPSATAAEPEYEIKFLVQPNGVIRRYVIDYGDFSIAADITGIEDVASPACG